MAQKQENFLRKLVMNMFREEKRPVKIASKAQLSRLKMVKDDFGISPDDDVVNQAVLASMDDVRSDADLAQLILDRNRYKSRFRK